MTSNRVAYVLLPAGIAILIAGGLYTARLIRAEDNARDVPTKARGPSVRRFFRISGIPPGWNEDDVLNALESINATNIHDNKRPQLSLYPAWSGLSQTGLLRLDIGMQSFETTKDEISLELSAQDKSATVVIDGHFHDLTPLNTPGNDVLADVVAVTDIGGHAFESWRSHESCQMWLNDFLPLDVKRIRIMSYGYNSSLIGETVDDDFLDYRRHFLQALANARRSVETRPIIFVGHGMGGILILQALLQSKQDERNRDVFESTQTLFFFGVPRQDQNVKTLLEMIEDDAQGGSPSRKGFVKQLDNRSNFLSTQREDITHLLGSSSSIEIIRFYETMSTPRLERTHSGRWAIGGDLLEIVTRNVAQLFLPYLHGIPVRQNHSNMVKFHSKADQTYRTVVTHLSRCVGKIAEKQQERDFALNREQKECLASLNESDCEAYRDQQLRKRHGNTCTWVLSDQGYRCWLENDDRPILWIHGEPGHGKTVLSSVLSKELCQYQNISFGRTYSVAYFFCDDKDARLKTLYGLLANVLAQLLRQDPSSLHYFSAEPAYKIDKQTTVWNVEMLWRVFKHIVKDEKRRPVCVIIDALDECEEAGRTRLLDELRGLFNDDQSKSISKRMKIVITSRPHIPVQLFFPDVIRIPLDPAKQKDDMVDYVRARVLELEQRNFPIELRDEIEEVLIERANGMFLWVHLILYDLKSSSKTTPYSIRQNLKALPETLPDLYTSILKKIKSDDRDTANSILLWVSWAERPLTVQELTVAIAIQPRHKSMSELSEMMEFDLKHVLQTILGALVEIQNDVVYLVHQSAKDFVKDLFKDTDLIENQKHSFQSNESNLYISVSCLTFLTFVEFETGPIDPQNGVLDGWQDIKNYIEKFPFLEYSSAHWSDHMRQIGPELQLQEATVLGESLLGLVEPQYKLYQAYRIHCHSKRIISELCEPLLIAAFFGFTGFFKSLLGRGSCLNDCVYVAASEGHDDLVRYLVEQNGFDVNAQGDRFGNPLQGAAYGGHGDIVGYLVEQGADVNSQGGYYGNPLQAATSRGHEDVARYLVEHGAISNAQPVD